MDLFWCISMTNNVKSFKTNQWKSPNCQIQYFYKETLGALWIFCILYPRLQTFLFDFVYFTNSTTNSSSPQCFQHCIGDPLFHRVCIQINPNLLSWPGWMGDTTLATLVGAWDGGSSCQIWVTNHHLTPSAHAGLPRSGQYVLHQYWYVARYIGLEDIMGRTRVTTCPSPTHTRYRFWSFEL